MRPHIVNGEFQSDKYPTTPRGKVPLSVKDKTAQDLLWEYAQRRRPVDAEFSEDLEVALIAAGFVPPVVRTAHYGHNDGSVAVCDDDGLVLPGGIGFHPITMRWCTKCSGILKEKSDINLATATLPAGFSQPRTGRR